MITRRHVVRMIATSALAPILSSRPAGAQAWPNRVVRFIVPLAAGGPTDVIARIVAEQLSKIWNQQVVIENRGGAGKIGRASCRERV